MVRLIALEGVGAAGRHRVLAHLAVAAEFGAGHTVGLGLGAAGGEMDGNGLSLRRMRHFDASRRSEHTPAALRRMSQMDYANSLFQRRRDP